MTVLLAGLAARSLTDQAVMQGVLIATGFVMVLVVLFLIALARAPVWQRDEAREGRDRFANDLALALAPSHAAGHLRIEPAVQVEQGWLIRVWFHNDGPKLGRFVSKVVALDGLALPGPEPPWSILWRHGGADEANEVLPLASELLNIGWVPTIDSEAARSVELARWYPSLIFEIAESKGGTVKHHPAPLANIGTYDDVARQVARLYVKVWELETSEVVAFSRLTIQLRDNGTSFEPELTLSPLEIGSSEET